MYLLMQIILCTHLLTTCALSNENITTLLADRLDNLNDKLSEHEIHQTDIQKGIQFDQHTTVDLNQKYGTAHLFNMFNLTYILMDSELFFIDPNNDKFITKAPQIFDTLQERLLLIKTVDYEDMVLIYMGFDNNVSKLIVYKNHTNEPIKVQTIKNQNRLTDAKFFINGNSLFLIVSSNLNNTPSPITVYKWEGSHLDEVAKELITGSAALHTFADLDSEIIVILCNQTENANSFVYKFNSNKLRKIQVLETFAPKFITSYKIENKQFLIIFEEGMNNVLYWWDGYELIPFQYFESVLNIDQILMAQTNSSSVLFAVNKDNIIVYATKTNSIQFIANLFIETNYKRILDVHIINTNILYLVGLAEDNTIQFGIFPFKLNSIETAPKKTENHLLIECLDDLENKIVINANELPVKKEEPHIYFSEPTIPQKPDVLSQANINSRFATTINIKEALQIHNKINQIEEMVTSLTPQIEHVLNDENPIINGKLIINGGLNTNKLVANNVHVKNLNNINWNPDNWLSYKMDQIVTGKYLINELHVDELLLRNENNLFNNVLLLNNTNQTMFEPITVNKFKATNIISSKINNIPISEVYLRNNSQLINGVKSFNNVYVDTINMDQLNNENASAIIKLFGDPKAHQYEFLGQLNIKNLNADFINGVNWDDFNKSVFRVGSDQTIAGDISIPAIKITHLKAKTISKIPIDTLLTTSTNQVIASLIKFTDVDANNIKCKTVNDLNFNSDVVIYGNEKTVINGPVTIKNMRITENLNINSPVNIDALTKQNHIVGTNETDLLQIYNNKVKITGSLRLQNVHMPQSAKLFANGNEFNQANFNDYWHKNTNQVIPEHFEATKGITTPHLTTQLLNDVPIDNYMTNNNDAKLPTNYHFENVTVLGNIIIDMDVPHTPNLQKIDTESVKLNGRFSIRGQKEFKEKLNVEHLKTDSINNLKSSDYVMKSTGEIRGTKTFENIIVHGNVNANATSTNKINDISIKDLYNEAILINETIQLNKINFDRISADNLFANTINGKNVNEYILNMEQTHLMDALNKLEVTGNAVIKNANHISTINNINIENLINQVQAGGSINGNITFQGKIHTKKLFVAQINDVNLQDLLSRLYFRNWNQNVTAKHTFKYLTASNILTGNINNINVENLIDIKLKQPQRLIAKNGLILNDVKFLKSVQAEYMQCDYVKAVRSVQNLPTKYWNSFVVLGNATVQNEDSRIGKLLMHSVSTKRDNVITSPVTFHNIHTENIYTKKHINDIDLQYIVEDALLSNVEDQLVVGLNTFSHVTAAGATIFGKAEIPVINKIDLLKLNASIIHKDDITSMNVKGTKTFFGGVQVTNLQANMVSGVLPENLVSLANLQQIPNATFDTLEIQNNFQIGYVNNQNFSQFLNDRLLLNTTDTQITQATYFIDEMQLNGNAIIPFVNNITMDEVVVDDGVQIITGSKKFIKDITVMGNIIIEKLNGFELSKLYQDSIRLDEQVDIQGNLRFNTLSEVTGNINTAKINGVSIELIKEMLQNQKPQVKANIIQNTIHDIVQLVDDNLVSIKNLPNQYLYLEKSDKLHIELPATDVQIVNNKNGGVILHLLSEEPGFNCGLPNACSCPKQSTLQITPEFTVNRFDNKILQRVYSYEHNSTLINVITNTKSNGPLCRGNESAVLEYTTIQWHKAALDQTAEKSFIYESRIHGYVSDIKFFSLAGYDYIIIARSYDPVLNTNSLDCMILRLSKDKTNIEEIQNIKTKGLFTLHVFHTAQGINLIIGKSPSTENQFEDVTTDIYRFNPITKRFGLMRHITTNSACISATSVVLEYDSFIILAYEKSPLHVFKYDHEHDNYYFYQHFVLEYPVLSVSVFYTGGVGIGDAYLTAVTKKSEFYLYSYQFLAGWKLVSQGEINGLRSLIPFTLNKTPFLFASSTNSSMLLQIIKYGFN